MLLRVRALPLKPLLQLRGLKTAIVGMPNVGKSTLFNALVGTEAAEASNYPFCTIDPNHGRVAVPDARLLKLAELSKSVKVVQNSMEIVDVAGLIEGASKGLGLGNQFLSSIRECHALIQVVRCFDDVDIHHVTGTVDPVRDADTINLELVLADLTMVEKRLEKKGKAPAAEKEVLTRIADHLGEGEWVRSLELSDRDNAILRDAQIPMLTTKPCIYAANVLEDDLADGNELVNQLREYADERGDGVIIVSAQTEFELTDLDAEDRSDMLEALGAEEDRMGMKGLVHAAYTQLGLHTFYTSGETESRAWTLRAGSTAPEAAGRIHTDLQNGFIKAETVSYDDMVTAGSIKAAKEAGLLRAEGKEYVVSDGDVMDFKFR
eukprot:gene5228-9381_t